MLFLSLLDLGDDDVGWFFFSDTVPQQTTVGNKKMDPVLLRCCTSLLQQNRKSSVLEIFFLGQLCSSSTSIKTGSRREKLLLEKGKLAAP